ncbi:MAG: hypothetical protein LQ352_001235 [Teloschistes flavicans]|nr:MAG: hypothetical protein LQ352_001235 [Teloschistes flavicans]
MSDINRPKSGVNNVANIKAFLSLMPLAAKSYTALSAVDGAASKVGELNIDEEKSTDNKANSGDVSTAESTTASKAASPESKASNTLLPEKVSDWIHEHPPHNHVKTKNPLLEEVQAHDSPKATGVLAPPPTPETISNLAIGRMISDELDKIPEDRILSLGDSRWAPKNTTRNTASTASLSSSEHFLSAIPKSTKQRDDQNFSRMSFKAADFPLTPITNGFKSNAPRPSRKSLSPTAPEWKPSPKENTPPEKASDSSPQTLITHVTDTIEPSAAVISSIAPHLRKSQTNAADQFHTSESSPPSPDGNSQGKDPAEDAPPFKEEDEDVEECSLPKPLFSFDNSSNGYDTAEMAGEILTPSSVTFAAVSPTKVRAASITTATKPAKIVGEDLEGALYFKAWPKVEERSVRSAAKTREVVLTGIPIGSTPTLVASLAYGGPLENIAVGSSTAYVTFLRAEDAAKFYETSANGLVYKPDVPNITKHVIMTAMSKHLNPVSGILREYIEKEFTRCVRAIGVDKEWTMSYMYETAARKGRRVEKIVDGVNVNNMRSVTFRFCNIADAVKFKQTVHRAEEWEECNVHFAPDP